MLKLFYSDKKYYYVFTRVQLLNLSLHLGHSKLKWLWYFKPYIYAIYKNNIIINLDLVLFSLKRSLLFISNLLQNYGKVFSISSFVNYKFYGLGNYFMEKIKCGYYDGKYVGGVISNFFQMKYMKKAFFYKFLTNVDKFKFLPSCFLVFDSNNFYSCFVEAAYIGIPSVGFIDTDLNYKNCLYPIISNNESVYIYIYYLILVVFLYKNRNYEVKKHYYVFLVSLYMYILKYMFFFVLIRTFVKNFKIKKQQLKIKEYFLKKDIELKKQLKLMQLKRNVKLRQQKFKKDLIKLRRKIEYKRGLIMKNFLRKSKSLKILSKFLFNLFYIKYGVEFEFLRKPAFAYKSIYRKVRVYTLPRILRFFMVVIRVRLRFILYLLEYVKYRNNAYIYNFGKVILFLSKKFKIGDMFNNLAEVVVETKRRCEEIRQKYNNRVRLMFSLRIVTSLLIYFKLISFFFAKYMFIYNVLDALDIISVKELRASTVQSVIKTKNYLDALWRYYYFVIFRLRRVFYQSRFFLRTKIMKRQKTFFLYLDVLYRYKMLKEIPIYENKYTYFLKFFKVYMKQYEELIGRPHDIFVKIKKKLPLNWRIPNVKYPFIRYDYKFNIWDYVLPDVVRYCFFLEWKKLAPNFSMLISLANKMSSILLQTLQKRKKKRKYYKKRFYNEFFSLRTLYGKKKETVFFNKNNNNIRQKTWFFNKNKNKNRWKNSFLLKN